INQSGSYKLSGNLTVPPSTNGININVDGVSLDLNGFSIIGAITCEVNAGGVLICSSSPGLISGISSTRTDVTVRDGRVSGFAFGMLLDGAGNLVEEMHISGNIAGLEVNAGVVRRSTMTRNETGMRGINSNLSENLVSLNNEGLRLQGCNLGNNTLVF